GTAKPPGSAAHRRAADVETAPGRPPARSPRNPAPPDRESSGGSAATARAAGRTAPPLRFRAARASATPRPSRWLRPEYGFAADRSCLAGGRGRFERAPPVPINIMLSSAPLFTAFF